MRLENNLMFINLADPCARFDFLEVGTTAQQLVAHQRGFHHTFTLITRFALKEICFVFRPPAHPVVRLAHS